MRGIGSEVITLPLSLCLMLTMFFRELDPVNYAMHSAVDKT